MRIDLNQGIDEHGRKFGYVHGDNGGYFFTWMPTLKKTLESVDVDSVDGDGGLNPRDVLKFLVAKIGKTFDSLD